MTDTGIVRTSWPSDSPCTTEDVVGDCESIRAPKHVAGLYLVSECRSRRAVTANSFLVGDDGLCSRQSCGMTINRSERRRVTQVDRYGLAAVVGQRDCVCLAVIYHHR